MITTRGVEKIKACRACGFASLQNILSLGDLHVSNFVDETEQKEFSRYPLTLVLCNKNVGGCGLLQLQHTVSNEILYRNYWYRSGTNSTMTEDLQDVVQSGRAIVSLKRGDFVLDIGSNDGTLLRTYGGAVRRVGFEPARNLIPLAALNAEKIINDFFNYPAWQRVFPRAKAKIITAIAMFYDLDKPNQFVADIKKCLHADGIFIIQMSYLPLMLSQNAFDNICHEHLEYYSLLSLEHLLSRHGLRVFDVELNEVNGGSFRVYVCHADARPNIRVPKGAAQRVDKLRKDELRLNLNERKPYDAFVRRVKNMKRDTVNFIRREARRGKKIYIYGASTKGNTLLQFYGLDASVIPFAVERNQDKWGKKTIGTLIPIISEEQARADKPDYFFVLPWHFLKEFVEREEKFLRGGGKFIVPLSEFKIIEF